MLVRARLFCSDARCAAAFEAIGAHEEQTPARVTDARAGAVAAENARPGERAQAESALTAALGGIRAVAEQYPQLRAADNFMRLQAQLAEIEDEIQASRRIYNSNAQ